MIIHDVEQNSPAWTALHLGRPTASEFNKIITPIGGDLSKQAAAYAYYKVAEAVLNEPLVSIDHLEWIDRGKILEPQAVAQYEFVNDIATRKVGFVTSDDGRFGCSPDRLVYRGDRLVGGLEVKCPAPQTHVGYWAEGLGPVYRPQVYGQMLICGLEWVDFYSYHPRMPPVQRRIPRDEVYIGKLQVALRQFDELLQSIMAGVRADGYFEANAAPVMPVDRLAEQLAYQGQDEHWA